MTSISKSVDLENLLSI